MYIFGFITALYFLSKLIYPFNIINFIFEGLLILSCGYQINRIFKIHEIYKKKYLSNKVLFKLINNNLFYFLFSFYIILAFSILTLNLDDFNLIINTLISSILFYSNFYVYLKGNINFFQNIQFNPLDFTWVISTIIQYFLIYIFLIRKFFLKKNKSKIKIIFITTIFLIFSFWSKINNLLIFKYFLISNFWLFLFGIYLNEYGVVKKFRKKINFTIFLSKFNLLKYFSIAGKYFIPFFLISNFLIILKINNLFSNKTNIKDILLFSLIVIFSLIIFYFRKKNLNKFFFNLFFFVILIIFSKLLIVTNKFDFNSPNYVNLEKNTKFRNIKQNFISCHSRKKNFCEFNKNNLKTIFLIGDSHADSILRSLIDNDYFKDYKIVHMSYSANFFMPNYSMINKITKNEIQKNYTKFRKEKITNTYKKDDVIIIFSRWSMFVEENYEKVISGKKVKVPSTFKYVNNENNISDASKGINLGLNYLTKNYKTILIYPFLEPGFNVPKYLRDRYLKNKKNKKLYNSEITMEYNHYLKRNLNSLNLLNNIKGKNIKRVFLDELFCDIEKTKKCKIFSNENLYLSDSHHPSKFAADLIVSEIEKILN